MDSFFGIGFSELVLILIIAGLVMGPERIRHVARTLGRLTAQMQAVSRQFQRQLNAELDALDSPELQGAVDDMKALRREMDDLRRQVRSMPQELSGEKANVKRTVDQALDEGRHAVRSARDDAEQPYKPVSRPSPAADETNGDAPSAPPRTTDLDSLPTPIEIADDPE